VIEVDDPDYPGFFRVVLNRHCAEMSDLPPADRGALMEVVWAVEETLRQKVCPDKINLASLGNVVPHLHWHVIPRWHDDRHFPNPVWGAEQRVTKPRRLDRDGLRAALQRRLAVFA
jgi:diadenosine tetraphosphate (Ap4A) HIT family hydrolase